MIDRLWLGANTARATSLSVRLVVYVLVAERRLS